MRRPRAFILAGALALAGALGLAGAWAAGVLSPAARWQGPHLQQTMAERVEVHVIVPHLPAPPGMAHYVEHLAWLNTIGGQARSIDRHSNAWTNAHAAGYWLTGRPEDLPDLLTTLARLFEPLDLDPAFAEEERAIILREYDMRLGTDREARMVEAMNAALYAGNARAQSLIGTPEEIAAFDLEAARALHAASHRPKRAALLVSGPISSSELHAALQRSGFPLARLGAPAIRPPAFHLAGEGEFRFDDPAFEGAPRFLWRKIVALPAPMPQERLEAQARLLSAILDSTLPGGLAGPLRHDGQVTRWFGVEITALDGQHVELLFRAEPDAGISFTRLQTEVEAALAITAQGIPTETFARLHRRLTGTLPDQRSPEETARRMSAMALSRLAQLRLPASEAELRSAHERITHDQINALAATLAGPGRSARSYLGRNEE